MRNRHRSKADRRQGYEEAKKRVLPVLADCHGFDPADDPELTDGEYCLLGLKVPSFGAFPVALQLKTNKGVSLSREALYDQIRLALKEAVWKDGQNEVDEVLKRFDQGIILQPDLCRLYWQLTNPDTDRWPFKAPQFPLVAALELV